MTNPGISIRLACLVYISETCYRYQGKPDGENPPLVNWVQKLTQIHKRGGFGLCFMCLRNVKGYFWNHKWVYRIYRELELSLCINPRRKTKRDYPGELDVPIAPDQVWSIGLPGDQLASGKTTRTFKVIDDYYREGFGIEVDLTLHSLVDWISRNRISLIYIQPGKPTQLSYRRATSTPAAAGSITPDLSAWLKIGITPFPFLSW